MRESISSAWRWLTTSRYCSHLESEISRLQQENKDLTNALLCASGLPMLPSHAPAVPLPKMRQRMLPSQYKAKMENFTLEKTNGKA
jgi:hypothetical protein